MAREKPLNPKQELFCHEYLKDLNGTQAAIRAGYSDNEDSSAVHAHQLLRNPKIQAHIQKMMDERSKRTEITVDYVVENLGEIVERCMERAPVMVRRGQEMLQLVDADGNHVWQFNANGANQALGLLGKHLKMFTERHEHSGPDGRPIEHKDVSAQSDAELRARLAELRAKEEG